MMISLNLPSPGRVLCIQKGITLPTLEMRKLRRLGNLLQVTQLMCRRQPDILSADSLLFATA